MIRHSRNPHVLKERLEKNLSKDNGDGHRKTVCIWLCKQILRSVSELCFVRLNKYSRDLYRCYEMFSECYPEKSDELQDVLYKSLNPISDKKEIEDLEKSWTRWIVEEKERLGW